VSSVQRKFTLVLATGAGVGYFPFFPGTMGTLFAVPISLSLNRLAEIAPMFALILLVGLTFGAIKISTVTAEILQTKDPQIIVADEIVGFMIANFLASLRWAPLLLGFLLFRIFDIAKVYPAAPASSSTTCWREFMHLSSSKPYFIGGGYDRKSSYLEYRR
jgi:phosphatidylglycerophosphatase A